MDKERLKYFESIILKYKNSMLHIFILYSMHCHENYNKLNYEEIGTILKFLYVVYMKDETFTDIGKFSDIAMDNYEKILDGTITKNNIYNLL